MHIVLAAKPDTDQPWITDAVARLARQTSATVSVVAVDHVELERFSAAPRSVFVQGAREAADAAVARLAALGVQARATVLPGRPLDRILEFAAQEQADLIVVGASTRPAVAERLLGSVPLQLIEKSNRPVVVITQPQMASLEQISLGVADCERAGAFWSAALGYVRRPPRYPGDDWIVLEPPPGRPGAAIAMDLSESPVQELPRVHLDLTAGEDGLDREVARLLALGARPVDWPHYPAEREPGAPRYVVLADPEGNRFCVADRS